MSGDNRNFLSIVKGEFKMTEEQLHKQTEQEQIELKALVDKSPKNKRRRLLKAAVAIPVIMTLSSGATAARSSNLVKAADSAEAYISEEVLNQPRVACVKSANSLGDDIYDLGDPVKATADLEPYIDPDPDLSLGLTPGQSRIETIRLQGENCETVNGGIMITTSAWDSVGVKIIGANF